MLAKKPPSPQRLQSGDLEFSSGLSSLPYDLLLNIATFLDLRDVHALHLVSSSIFSSFGVAPESRPSLQNTKSERVRDYVPSERTSSDVDFNPPYSSNISFRPAGRCMMLRRREPSIGNWSTTFFAGAEPCHSKASNDSRI